MSCNIGQKINKLSYLIKREFLRLPAIEKLDKVSATNGFILLYIFESKDDVFQKDIENHFGMTRSTASRVITLMEQKNLIIRENVEKDQRLKKLKLTDESIKLCSEASDQVDQFEKNLSKDINKDTFFKELDIIYKNINGGMMK